MVRVKFNVWIGVGFVLSGTFLSAEEVVFEEGFESQKCLLAWGGVEQSGIRLESRASGGNYLCGVFNSSRRCPKTRVKHR